MTEINESTVDLVMIEEIKEPEVNLELNDEIVDGGRDVVCSKDPIEKLKLIIEAILMAADKPLDLKGFTAILDEHNNNPNTRTRDKIKFDDKDLKLVLEQISLDFTDRAIELKFLGAGYRIQTKAEYAPWVQGIWQEKPSKYSKATLETLAIIAYRQPVTRAEIEHVRGVAVSSQIMRNLQDREWIRVVGHRDLPGRPAIYATTQQFLFDLNLTKLEDLPTLADIKEIKQNLFDAVPSVPAGLTSAVQEESELEQLEQLEELEEI